MDFDVPILTDADFGEAPPPPAKPAPTAESLVDGLTEPQKQAVLHTEGPLLVLAAAGSGKTRVITRRIAYLVHCGVPPWQILALTFTNKAAGEMRERVFSLLGQHEGGTNRATRGLTITTFHSLCARLLRRHAEAAGLKPDFAIYDSADQLTIVKKAIEACQLSTANFQPRSVLGVISNAKNDLIDAEQFAQSSLDFSTKCIAKVYSSYTTALRRANAVDFDDLLLLTARVLSRNEQVRTVCRERWQYLMIDEYQDTNKAQFQIASIIAGGGGGESGGEPRTSGPNICVVGDPDQAIYGWRGADISNILDFERYYPAAATIKLGENFRSTAPILAVADHLIKRNRRRKDKPLFTVKTGGEMVEVNKCRDERHEATVVAQWLRSRHESVDKGGQGLAWREMAIFYRTNALSRVMEEALREYNVPYTIARGTAFYDREEIKNALAYLRLVANSADSVSLGRIVNVPSRGIGDTSYDRIEMFADQSGVTVLEAMHRVGEVPDLTARAVNSVTKFVQMVDGWISPNTLLAAAGGSKLSELVDRVVRESGLEAMYKAQAATSKTETDAERLDNLAELVSSAAEFEQEYDPSSDPMNTTGGAPSVLDMLRAYLESIALVADADAVDPSQGSVTLMTLHAAKGLEFGGVAMIGLEEGLLPHMRAQQSEPAMEEERRLCFVGITRAMRRLLITSSNYRTMRGMSERTIPSRFLSELPAEHVSVRNMSDVSGGLGDEWGEQHDSGDIEFSDAARAPSRPKLNAPFPVGCEVRHPQFGLGKVQAVTGGANARVTVAFRGLGVKTLVLEYARLTRV